MSCIYTYKGQKFATKSDVIQSIKDSKTTPAPIDFDREVVFKAVNVFTTVQEEEITLTLAAAVFKSALRDIDNFSTTDFTAVVSEFISKKLKKHKDDAYKERYEELSRHVPGFVGKVKSWYKTKGLEIVEELQETEDGLSFKENALLIDPKQNASAKIRALISLVPKYTRNKSGRAVEDTDTFLGEPKFVAESAMWNTLKNGLSDIANPSFEKMDKKLEEMSVSDPSMTKLRDALKKKKQNPITGKEELDETLRTQFFNVYALNRVEYMSLLLSGEPGNGMSVKLSTTDPSSQQSMLIRSWAENFAFLTSDTQQQNEGKDAYYYSPKKLENILNSYNSVANKVKKEVSSLNKINIKNTESVRGKSSEKIAANLKYELLATLDLMGIDMDIAGLNNLLRDSSFQSSQGSSEVSKSLSIFQLNKLFGRGGLKFLMERVAKTYKKTIEKDDNGNPAKVLTLDKEGKTLLEDEKSIIKLLAKKQGQTMEDLAESNSLGAEGNLYSNYSTHNLMTSLINEWNEDASKLDRVTSTVNGLHSRLASWMKSDTKNNKLKLFVLNNFKTLGKGDQGDKVSKLSDPELLGAHVNVTLSDGKTATYMGLAEADKARQVAMKGGDFVSSGLNYNESGTSAKARFTLANENTLDVFIDYFADEVFRMQAIWNDLNGDTAIPENERIAYLHDPKNAYTSYLFPEFNIADKNDITPLERFGVLNRVMDENGKPAGYKPTPTLTKEDLSNNYELKKAIESAFLNAVYSDVGILVENGILANDTLTNNDTGERLYRYKNIGIDKNVVGSRYKGNVIEAVADFTLNSIIGSVEVTKLFTGDPASFKSAEGDLFKDFRKRIPSIISGGIKSRIYKSNGKWEVPPTYTSAVTANVEAPSDYFFPTKDSKGNPVVNDTLLDNMLEAFNESKEGNEIGTKEDMLSFIENYKNVNVTDAQAWITLDTFVARMKSYGKWTDEHQDAYERMTAKNPKLLPEDVKLFMQPLKTVHIEESKGTVHSYLHFNKQSEAVIIPGLFPGLDAMQAANPEVDHFITLDGKKTGASGVVSINDGMNMRPKEELELNYVTLSYDRLYLQQDLTAKQVKNTLVGSQVVKNLLGEIVLKGEYEIPVANGEPKKVSGADLITEYHEVVGLLSDIGGVEVQQKFGYDPETGNIDQEKFNDFLIESLEDELTSSDISALESGISLDSLPALRKKLESKLMAAVAKKTIKLKQSGGAMIQMSSFGTLAETISITEKVKDGIIWLKDNVTEGLKPMQLKKDKDTGKLYTEKAQVLLPHKLIVDLLGSSYKNMTSEQIKKMINPDVLMGISYRIPNQATASNDLFEIVGILPPEAGDTIISYNEITTKTGSDFDIDKAFIIVPNIEVDKETGKIRRPKYSYEFSSDKEAYEEKFKKDWGKSTRARELTKDIEKTMFEKKQIILTAIKDLKGSTQVSQALRDIAPNSEENIEEDLTSGDLVSLISRYFDANIRGEEISQEFDERKAEERMNPILQKKNRDTMLGYKNSLKKIDAAVRAKVRQKLLEEKTAPSLEEFEKYNANQKHTRAALENRRLDLMQSLLGDPKTYPSAVASLDNDTLKDAAKELYEPKEIERNLGFYRGTNQAKTKGLFDKAKNLVGVIANQMVDHKSSQSFELVYNNINFQIGNSIDNETLVSSTVDENGMYTSSWLNLYMNAIVDAAKDPFIVNANINQFTSPVAFMLIRSGVPIEWVNAYMGQPILKELVQLKSMREGRFSQKVYDKETGKKVTPEEELIKKYSTAAGMSEKEVNQISFKNLKTISEKKLKNEIQNKVNYKTQVAILQTFNAFKDVSKDLTDVIRASKADVGNGKDLMQAELKEAKLMQVIKKGTIKNVEKKFGATSSEEFSSGIAHKDGFIDLDGSTMAGVFHRNGIQLPSKMFSGQTVMSTNAIKNLVFSTIFDLNPDLLNRDKSIDTIMNEIYSFIMGMESANVTNGDIKSMFYSDNSFPRRLEKFKNSNPDLVASNILLRDLTISYRMDKESPDFVIFNNKSTDRELYQRAWSDLFESSPETASELVNYSYSSSGFNRNLFSFFQHIPTEELVNRGIGDFMSNLKVAFSETAVLQNAKEQIIRHLADNPAVITTVGPRDMLALNDTISNKAAFILENIDEYVIGSDIYGKKETSRWLRDSNSNLYKLVGYAKKGPMYMAVSKRGYYSKGKVIKEYYTPNNSLTSLMEEENGPIQSVRVAGGMYTKDMAENNKDIGYIFTENLQARLAVNEKLGIGIEDSTSTITKEEVESIPSINPVLNVKIKNNQAGIRTTQKGIINENALGIVTKKYQQGKDTKFVYEEGNFKDTNADFTLFKKANEEVFEEMAEFATLVIPNGFATSKAKLPKRFSEWLQQNLLERFGVETSLNITKTASGSTASINTIGIKSEESKESQGTVIEKNKQVFVEKAKEDPYYNIKTPDVFVPLANYRGAINAWKSENAVIDYESVVDSLQSSVLARSEKETGITNKQVEEAKKICKI
tara:strand:+ start:2998 stop:10455 length:7458 start_codon:yes stop_codon:yes gene_type:complete